MTVVAPASRLTSSFGLSADITQMNDDCLDAHRWIYSGALNKALASATKKKGEERLDKPPKINVDRISAAGYSCAAL